MIFIIKKGKFVTLEFVIMECIPIFDNVYSEERNKKKIRIFNRFINSILENPFLRPNEIIEDYLTKNISFNQNLKNFLNYY